MATTTIHVTCADGSNNRISCHADLSYRVDFILRHAMATATTKWLQQQHLLAARFSSFISCRSKATTNGEEMSARYIASRDGDDDLSCHVAPMAATTTFRVTQWRRQQNHGCDNNIAACTIVITYNIASHSGDNDNASRDGDDLSYCVARLRRQQRFARWRRLQRVARWRALIISLRAVATTTLRRWMATTYHITSRDGDDDNASLDGDDLSYRVARWRRRQRVEHRRYNQLLKTSA